MLYSYALWICVMDIDDIQNRRFFLRNLGVLGGGILAATSPWLSIFADVKDTSGERLKLGVIGPGSRGRFLMKFLAKNKKVDIVAIADIYQPSIDEALEIVPTAKVYKDYRRLLADKNIQQPVCLKFCVNIEISRNNLGIDYLIPEYTPANKEKEREFLQKAGYIRKFDKSKNIIVYEVRDSKRLLQPYRAE